jgi:hypothetical protein
MQFCHSEKEARGKICPALPLDQGAPAMCFASDCMAWRWVMTHIRNEETGDLDMPSGDTHGYCGLAGPEWVCRR